MRRLKSAFLAGLAVLLLGCLAAGTASATILTDGSGKQLAVGTVIKAESETFPQFHWAWPDILCESSSLEAKIVNAGGVGTAVVAQILSLTFSGCGESNCPVVVLKNGELLFQTEGSSSNGNGTVTVKGVELTTNCSGFHCKWGMTNLFDIGVLTGGSPASLLINARYPRVGGESTIFCGESQNWTGRYKITSPSALSVD